MDGVIVERIPVNRFFRRRVKFHFGMWVWFMIADSRDIAFEELGNIPTDRAIPETFYHAAEWAAFKDGKRRRISMKSMERAIDLMPNKQLQRIVKCMMDSKFGGETFLSAVEKHKKKQQHKS